MEEIYASKTKKSYLLIQQVHDHQSPCSDFWFNKFLFHSPTAPHHISNWKKISASQRVVIRKVSQHHRGPSVSWLGRCQSICHRDDQRSAVTCKIKNSIIIIIIIIIIPTIYSNSMSNSFSNRSCHLDHWIHHDTPKKSSPFCPSHLKASSMVSL